MKRNLYTSFMIPYNTPEWHEFRSTGILSVMYGKYDGGIGASEIGSLLEPALNPYLSKTRLYYQKIGMISSEKQPNEKMIRGIVGEDIVAQLWQYYDPETLDFTENFYKQNIIRTCRKNNAYLVSKEHSHLFCSLDREISVGAINIFTNKPTEEANPLELKNIGRIYAKQWVSGIPPWYLIQTQQQMLITGTEYCELALYYDDGKLDVYPFEYDKEIGGIIIQQSTDFWNVIKLGKKAFMKYMTGIATSDKVMEDEGYAEMIEHEPEPDISSSEDYIHLMSEVARRKEGEISALGDDDDFYEALDYVHITNLIKILRAKQGLVKANIVKRLHHLQADRLKYGDDVAVNGYTRRYQRSNSDKLTTDIRPKPLPDVESAAKVINKINLKFR